MLSLFLLALSLGIEGGYTSPAVGFNNLHSGNALSLYALTHTPLVDVSLGLHASLCAGKNAGYSTNFYGVHGGILKARWLFSPVVECGINYATHTLGSARELGVVFNYTVGVALNFRTNRLRIYPLCYYEGYSDFQKHAGFVGIKLGIGYELKPPVDSM
jgi:hypothetical protein